jgi:hypothetical protein
VISATLALAVAVLPRSSLLAAALFVAIAAVVFVIAFEGWSPVTVSKMTRVKFLLIDKWDYGKTIMAIVVVSSVFLTGCQRAEATKPWSTTPIPHTVKVIRYCFYWIAPIAVPSKLASGRSWQRASSYREARDESFNTLEAP